MGKTKTKKPAAEKQKAAVVLGLQTPEERVEASTFVLSLTAHTIRTSAKVKREQVVQMARGLSNGTPETVAEMAGEAADELYVSKELLKVPEIAALMKCIEDTRWYIRNAALPVRFLKGGLYLYAATRVEWAEEKISEAQKRIDELFAKLEPRWQDVLEEDRKRLEPLGLYDPTDYPTLSAIREATRLKHSWMRFAVPTELKAVNKALFEAERAKALSMWSGAAEQIRLVYRETLLSFVEGLRDTLKPGEDGKKRVIRQAKLDKMLEFLSTYRLQDVTNDEELARLVEAARGTLNGIDAEVLRVEAAARERVTAELAAIKDDLQPLVIEQQRRVTLRD